MRKVKTKFKLSYITLILSLLSFLTVFLGFIKINDLTISGLDVVLARNIKYNSVSNAGIVFNFTYILAFILVLFSGIISLMEDKASLIIAMIFNAISVIFIILIPSNLSVKTVFGDNQLIKDVLPCMLSYGGIIMIVLISGCIILEGLRLQKLFKNK